jgi:hypothetical protein
MFLLFSLRALHPASLLLRGEKVLVLFAALLPQALCEPFGF